MFELIWKLIKLIESLLLDALNIIENRNAFPRKKWMSLGRDPYSVLLPKWITNFCFQLFSSFFYSIPLFFSDGVFIWLRQPSSDFLFITDDFLRSCQYNRFRAFIFCLFPHRKKKERKSITSRNERLNSN